MTIEEAWALRAEAAAVIRRVVWAGVQLGAAWLAEVRQGCGDDAAAPILRPAAALL
jgi:hypothetical protein